MYLSSIERRFVSVVFEDNIIVLGLTPLAPPPPASVCPTLPFPPLLVAIIDIGGSSAPSDRAPRQADSETLQRHRIPPSYYLLYSYLHNWLITGTRRTAFRPRLFRTTFIQLSSSLS